MRNLFLFIYLFITAARCLSQESSVEEARALFPDANAIILNRSEDFKISIDDDKIKATCNRHQQLYINKDAALIFQNKSINTNSFVSISDINAFTLAPKNNKYEKKKVEKIELKDDVDEST